MRSGPVVIDLLQEVASDIDRDIGAAAQNHEGGKGDIVFFPVTGKPGVRALVNLGLTGLAVNRAARRHAACGTASNHLAHHGADVI